MWSGWGQLSCQTQDLSDFGDAASGMPVNSDGRVYAVVEHISYRDRPQDWAG